MKSLFTSKAFKLAAVAAATIALQTTASAATFVALSSPGFTTETTSVGNNYLMPVLAGNTVSSFSVLSTNAGFSSTAVVTFAAPTTSFSFLWGSPDTFNTVSDVGFGGTKTVNGSVMSSGSGNNSESFLYTFTDTTPFSALTFKTTGVAFELAVAAPVPEPETYALMLAGLGAMAFVARRRKNA